MRRTWLIFSQAVTVAVALLFVVGTLKPEWLQRVPAAVPAAIAPPALPVAAPAPVPAVAAPVNSYAGAIR